MIVTQTINVHLDKPATPTVETVQSDTGRAVRLELFSAGAPWTAPEGTTGTIRYSIFHEGEAYTSLYDTLPDGSAAVSFSNSTATVVLSPEVLSIPGVGQLQVELRSGDSIIATFSVLLRVQRNLALEGITPSARTDLSHQVQNEVYRQIQAMDRQSAVEELHRRVDTTFTAGALASGTGAETTSTTRIRSGFIPHGGRELTVTLPAGVKARCFFYDSSRSFKNESSFYTDTFTIHNGNAYLRIVVAYADDGEVSEVAPLAAQVGIFYPSDDFDNYRGYIKSLGYTSFAQCTASGYYRFTGEDVPNITDAPSISKGGVLRVESHGSTNVVFQTIQTTNNQIWFRWGSHPFTRLVPRGEPQRWYCLGDSIAQGYYSDSTGLHLDANKGWATIAAAENGWELTNLAVGGSGYVCPATVGDKLNARDHVDSVDFSQAELVTLAFGVNDWKGDYPLGSMTDDVATGGTFYSNTRYCIEKILTDQPCVRLVVISPIPCCAYGTEVGDWGTGYAFAGGRLGDFRNALREICQHYEIGFIDLLSSGVVNRINAPAVLPDGVHPSIACHRLLGLHLAGLLK